MPKLAATPSVRFTERDQRHTGADLHTVTFPAWAAISVAMGEVAGPGSLDRRRQPLRNCRRRLCGRCIIWGRCPHMVRLSLTRLAAAVGGLTLALTAGAGVASADPMDGVINTTCNYGQVMAALNATDPGAAAQFEPIADGAGLLAPVPGVSAAEARADGPADAGHARKLRSTSDLSSRSPASATTTEFGSVTAEQSAHPARVSGPTRLQMRAGSAGRRPHSSNTRAAASVSNVAGPSGSASATVVWSAPALTKTSSVPATRSRASIRSPGASPLAPFASNGRPTAKTLCVVIQGSLSARLQGGWICSHHR